MGKKVKTQRKRQKIGEIKSELDNYIHSVNSTDKPIEKKKDEDIFFVDKASTSTPQRQTKIQYWRARLPYYERALLPDGKLKFNQQFTEIAKPVRKQSTKTEEAVLTRLTKSVERGTVLENPKEKLKEKRVRDATDVAISSDIWTTSTAPSTVHEFIDGIVNAPAVKRRAISNRPMTDVPPVPVPASGKSYNPTFDSHQDELGQALAEELNHISKEEKLNALLPSKKILLAAEPIENEIVEEEEEEEEEGNFSENSDKEALKRPKPRTEKHRKKERAQRILEQQHKIEKEKKKLNTQVTQIPYMLKLLQKQERYNKEREKLKSIKEEEEKIKTKQIGRKMFREPAKLADMLLTEELPGKLRKLKATVGTAAQDRWNSMLRRNIMAPRSVSRKAKLSKPKYKLKDRFYLKDDI